MFKRFALTAALLAFGGLLPIYVTAALSRQPPAWRSPLKLYLAATPLLRHRDRHGRIVPKDVVVWLNIPSGIAHYKGERWYGRTKHGAYACEKEAIKVGDRASENGQ